MKTTMNRNQLSELSSSDNEKEFNEFVNKVSQFSGKALDSSRETIEKGVDITKKYPVHTALGLGAFGFLAGAVTSRIMK